MTTPYAPCHTFYARWREHAVLPSPVQALPTLIHCYEIIAPLPTPLSMNMRIRLIALSPRQYERKRDMPDRPEFETYDPEVEGTVVGLRNLRGDVVEAVVANGRRRNKVAFAHLTLNNMAGNELTTGHISDHHHWIFAWMPSDPWPVSPTNGVVIYDETPNSSYEEEPMKYPDPQSSYATIVEATTGVALKRTRDRRKPRKESSDQSPSPPYMSRPRV